MPANAFTRRAIVLSSLAAPLAGLASPAGAAAPLRMSIIDSGAVADSATVNTGAIQKSVDRLAAGGGATVVVPPGVFVSGALFMKPGVHLHLEAGAVLRCSTDMRHFPTRRTRIEGHFADSFNPALVNADGCDGFTLSGQGVLDGAGRPIWDQFWRLRNASPKGSNFPNIGVPRARLVLIERSADVTVDGVTFRDSQFWNLHLYRCQRVVVRRARFEVPDDVEQAPSTDGIDLDSCQHVRIEGCYFSVTDDCIAAKGSKGPFALDDKDSPPVIDVRVRDCEFRRGHSVMTLGSEATLVRDVRVEGCRITGSMHSVAMLKLRRDTPQHYEDIHLRDITIDSDRGALISIQPWVQYTDLKGAAPPASIVRNLSMTGITGRTDRFGNIRPNAGQTTIEDILFKDIDVRLNVGRLDAHGVRNLRLENVRVNGRLVDA